MPSVSSLSSVPCRTLYNRILNHLLGRLQDTVAEDKPFSHMYVTDVLPADVFEFVLEHLPTQDQYVTAAERHYEKGEGNFVRSMFALSTSGLEQFPESPRNVWRAVAAALTSPETKDAVYTVLAKDLAFRYGVPMDKTADLAGHSRPTLYRETEGFEIPPHPDTRKKVVTMHLYFPADLTQIGLGTALYRRRPLALPIGKWQGRFEKVKQFEFRPNSCYAFVVNNTLTKKSWHGREQLPPGSGVRNTLLNTFYELPREGYSGYLDEGRVARAA